MHAASWESAVDSVSPQKRQHGLSCDITHAQDSSYNRFVRQTSTAGSSYDFFGQGCGYECHSSWPLRALLRSGPRRAARGGCGAAHLLTAMEADFVFGTHHASDAETVKLHEHNYDNMYDTCVTSMYHTTFLPLIIIILLVILLLLIL